MPGSESVQREQKVEGCPTCCPPLGSDPGLCLTVQPQARTAPVSFTVLVNKMEMTRASASLGSQGSVRGGGSVTILGCMQSISKHTPSARCEPGLHWALGTCSVKTDRIPWPWGAAVLEVDPCLPPVHAPAGAGHLQGPAWSPRALSGLCLQWYPQVSSPEQPRPHLSPLWDRMFWANVVSIYSSCLVPSGQLRAAPDSPLPSFFPSFFPQTHVD